VCVLCVVEAKSALIEKNRRPRCGVGPRSATQGAALPGRRVGRARGAALELGPTPFRARVVNRRGRPSILSPPGLPRAGTRAKSWARARAQTIQRLEGTRLSRNYRAARSELGPVPDARNARGTVGRSCGRFGGSASGKRSDSTCAPARNGNPRRRLRAQELGRRLAGEKGKWRKIGA